MVKSKQELWEEQLEALNKKIMGFDQERLDYYTEKFYHTHDNRVLFPEEWKVAQAYHDDFLKTEFKRDDVYRKLNSN